VSKNLMIVITRNGGKIEVDVSDEACAKFKILDKSGSSFPAKKGMKIICPQSGEGELIGVGKNFCPCGRCSCDGKKKVLWVVFDRDDGKASFSDPSDYIRK